MITALVEIYYSGRLNRPLITFQQAGRKWSRAAVLVTALGASLYQTADLGIAPYDYLSLGLRDYTPCPYFRVPHLHRCAQRSIILWSSIPNSCIVAWILRCSFFMVSTTILLNSGVYRLFGTPFGIATPHLLDSISYCLTNGVLFIISSSILTVQKEHRKSTDTLL